MMKKGKRLVYGIGVNDADYDVSKYKQISKGKKIRIWECPFYRVWRGMLGRCYHPSMQQRSPTYNDVTVCPDWIYFSNFKAWMEQQDWEGKELDKDLLVKGNKIYSPETCYFIDASINNLVTDRTQSKRKYLMGVAKGKRGRLKAVIRKYGKSIHIGCFDTEEEAHEAWLKAKKEHVDEIIATQTDPVIIDALRRWFG